jgi:hypothetical protein
MSVVKLDDKQKKRYKSSYKRNDSESENDSDRESDRDGTDERDASGTILKKRKNVSPKTDRFKVRSPA